MLTPTRPIFLPSRAHSSTAILGSFLRARRLSPRLVSNAVDRAGELAHLSTKHESYGRRCVGVIIWSPSGGHHLSPVFVIVAVCIVIVRVSVGRSVRLSLRRDHRVVGVSVVAIVA